MKKLFLILPLLSLSLSPWAQPNARLQDLERMLKEQGFNLTHFQRTGRGIEHRWMVPIHLPGGAISISEELIQKMSKNEINALKQRIDSTREMNAQRISDAVALIRSTFSTLAAEASESYMFEVHNDSVDSVRLSMAWGVEHEPLKSWNADGGVHYDNAREAVSLDFQHWPKPNTSHGYYTHVYILPYPEGMGDIKSFDIEAFQALISPTIKKALKLKGASKLPVYWRHDQGYQADVAGELIWKVTRQSSDRENKHTGLTTGYMYFIPKVFEHEANELLITLDSLAHAYVDVNYDQDYNYRTNPRYSLSSGYGPSIISGTNWPDKKSVLTEYTLGAYIDEYGFYILSTTTEGELWMPRDFTRLKSWINGERVLRKQN